MGGSRNRLPTTSAAVPAADVFAKGGTWSAMPTIVTAHKAGTQAEKIRVKRSLRNPPIVG